MQEITDINKYRIIQTLEKLTEYAKEGRITEIEMEPPLAFEKEFQIKLTIRDEM
ncbi:hypothetical protein [Halobacillus massiliensis]|uniref:hypothetical protein n=1 Tax=Halobacillus massiliensis TaxID=1926286 RepID=UPI0015C4202C|nr:hypothetical protein [Halobacillus massiliensis]